MHWTCQLYSLSTLSYLPMLALANAFHLKTFLTIPRLPTLHSASLSSVNSMLMLGVGMFRLRLNRVVYFIMAAVL